MDGLFAWVFDVVQDALDGVRVVARCEVAERYLIVVFMLQLSAELPCYCEEGSALSHVFENRSDSVQIVAVGQ